MAALAQEAGSLSGSVTGSATGSTSRSPATAIVLDVAVLRERFRHGKAELLEQFRSARATSRAATQLTKALTRHVDRLLVDIWAAAGMPAGAALVAVGGYGRAELFPYSDVDVLVLLPSAHDSHETDGDAGGTVVDSAQDGLHQAIETFLQACWDIGIEIGSSVRSVDECAELATRDITVQTAMLESRWLCGCKRVYAAFRQATDDVMDSRAFLRAKVLEMRQRHTKYENTPYSLEPNCKESPGGLRDLQLVIWVARAAGLGRSWNELAGKGLVMAFEASRLRKHEGTLKLIRARLQLIAGRREDRLVFDLQTAVAESFGYRAAGEHRASEVLMHRYYWAAKAVTQLNQVLMLNIEERLSGLEQAPMRPIDEDFLDRGGMLEVAHDRLYIEKPHAILRTFLVYQQVAGIKGFSARTLRALYNARTLMNAQFRHDPVSRAQFMQILQQPQGITHALRLLNQTSVLGRYLWVFRRIVGRMQHDLFHVYTVDQHILMVVRNMRRFFIPEHAHEYPFCSQLASQWDEPWLLYVAALFHDVAKGRGGDHSVLGAAEARRFCRDHGVSREDCALIEFLVLQHLTMSRIAQKDDLSDVDVIQSFARLVGTPRRLTAMYLLTVADLRGTSPKVWNAWKGKLLEDLYRLTERTLGGRAPDPGALIEARKREALVQLALASERHESHKALWDTLDVSYFMRHDAGDIAWHARQLARHVRAMPPAPARGAKSAGQAGVGPTQNATHSIAARADGASAEGLSGTENKPLTIVRARLSPIGEGLQVLVYASDRPDLFARICGYFDRAGFSILDAKIHTTRNGYALDTFQIVNATEVDHYREFIHMVEADMPKAITSTDPLAPPRLGRVSRRVKSFPVTPRIDLRPDDKAQHWLLTVSASDRVGLLYSIARVLAAHQIDLELAKVTTLGERVEDMFLLQGAQLQHNKTQLAIEQELLEVLDPD